MVAEEVNIAFPAQGYAVVATGDFPQAPACVAENSGPICDGDLLTIDAEYPGAISYVWTSVNGSATILTPFSASSTVVGAVDGEIFEVTITDADGCEYTCSTTATVNENPGADPSTNAPICEGETLQIVCKSKWRYS